MAFQFSNEDRSVQSGVRRIAREELDEALACLQVDLDADADAVHGLRKATKKLRGLIRLIRPVCPMARDENAALREAARQLAELRDADVMQGTLESLANALPSPVMAPLRDALEARRQAAAHPGALSDAVRGLGDEFAALRGRCRRWKVGGKAFDALQPGLTDTWRRCRKGLRQSRAAAEDPGFPAAAFHEWRKPVKQHWYQARLLEPIWPAMMAPHVAQADTLGELLGDHNDLDVLLVTLEADPALQGDSFLAPLRGAVLARRQALAGQAVELGARLFAEPADALAGRWGRWWRLWRA